jgi:PAS domain S-box-containing protein
MASKARTRQELQIEVANLRARVAEAEEILRAIRDYEVDAVVVQAPQGDRVYALETADHAYRQMVEQMREGAATLTPDGVVLFANQPLVRMLHGAIEQVVGEPFTRYLLPEEQPRLLALLQQPAGGRLAAHLHTIDGERLPVSISASRVLIEDAPVALLLITDVTYERQADRVTKLLHLSTRLSAAITYAQVGEAIVNGAIRVFEADCGFVAVPATAGNQWYTLFTTGYSPERVAQIASLPLQTGQPVSDAILARAPVLVETAADLAARYPGWLPPTAEAGGGPLLAVPLLLLDRLVGVLHIEFHGAWTLEAEDRDLVLTVAQQCAQALERASLYNELEQRIHERTRELQTANDRLATANRRLRDEIAERRAVQRQLERSREEERMRIARELHDELGGDLTALKMDVSRVLRGKALSADLRKQLAEVNHSIEAAIHSVRRLATELRPQILDELGLVPALEAHFQEFLKRSGLTGELVCTVEDDVLNAEAATACFRIFQEALTNVARHANATHVSVHLEPDGDSVLLRVVDNGRGMRAEERQAPGHLGLIGIQERASVLAAHVEISSTPGAGTTVLLRMPLGPADTPS